MGYALKVEEALVLFVMSPTLIFGIWHGGDFLKEIFRSVQSMVEWYMEVANLVAFAYVNNIYFPLVF